MKRTRWMMGLALVAAGLTVWLALRGSEARRHVPVAERPRPVRAAPLQEAVTAPVPRRPLVVAPAAAPAPAPVLAADPMLSALSTTKKGSAVVVEVSALLNLPVGRFALDCLQHAFPESNPFQKFRDQVHVDALRDLDRVALMDDGLVLSGQFAGARWDRLFHTEVEATSYGTRSTYFEPKDFLDAQGRRHKPNGDTGASMGDTLFFIGSTGNHTRQVVDVIEGREPAPAPILTSAQTYGEVYGILSGQVVAEHLPWDQGEFRAMVREVVDTVEVHVDASRDVRITADFKLLDAARTDELAARIEAALELLRQQVREGGHPILVMLLEQTRLVSDGGQLRLEVDVPLATLERDLAYCREPVAARPRASVR